MNRTPVSIELSHFPEKLHPCLSGAAVFDSSCSAQARVYFIDKDNGFYLKTAPVGSLKAEAEMTPLFSIAKGSPLKYCSMHLWTGTII